MDTTGDIEYRTVLLNDASIQENITGGGASGHGIRGCVIDSFDMSDVDVVQWLEKRSQADGSDAGDVTQGVRRVRMAGTLYDTSRPALFDALFELRAALNPVLAQREEPADKGYRPLYFSVPTNRIADYPAGRIELQIKALPRSFQQLTDRDRIGGEDDDPLAVPWQASFVCRDPGIYSRDFVNVAFDTFPAPVTGTTGNASTNLFTKTGHGLVAGDRITFSALTGGLGMSTGTTYYVIASGLTTDTFKLSTTSGGAEINFTTDATVVTWVKSVTFSGTWENRGNYLAKFNALFVVNAGAGSISVNVGDSVFTVTVPASSAQRIIRIKDDKMITFEENDVETMQFGRITSATENTWPLIDPATSPYSVTCHGMGGLAAGGHMWFYEQYA